MQRHSLTRHRRPYPRESCTPCTIPLDKTHFRWVPEQIARDPVLVLRAGHLAKGLTSFRFRSGLADDPTAEATGAFVICKLTQGRTPQACWPLAPRTHESQVGGQRA
eukprot:4638427-Amphidinium_carterae.1